MNGDTANALASSGKNGSPLDAFRTHAPHSGDLAADVPAFLVHYGHVRTAEHSERVAVEAGRLAARFEVHIESAEAAGWLHDISAIFPAPDRANVARQLGIDILPAEEAFPMIAHQKLSVVVAQMLFGITDASVLSAIGCHTTLRRDPSQLDKVLFVADKIAWDQFNDPPYLDALQAALDASLDAAAYCYLDYLWQQRHSLRVVHPWTVVAHEHLARTLSLPPKSWQQQPNSTK